MKYIVVWELIIIIFFHNGLTAPCDESRPWVETVDIAGGCQEGKELHYQCKDCICDEGGKTASCPKWIKCCKLGESWSTNSCNQCFCDEKYQRICRAVKCSFKKT